MKEQFDKKLAEKIKASFKNHEEVPDPKEWEKLSRTYFNPKKGVILSNWGVWLSGIAASLLLIFFLYFNKENTEMVNISEADSSVIENKTTDEKEIQFPLDTLANLKNLTDNNGSSKGLRKAGLDAENSKVPQGGPAFVSPSLLSNNNQIPDLTSSEILPLEEREKSPENVISDRKIKEEIVTNPLISQLQDNELEKAKESIRDWLDVVKTDTDLAKVVESYESFRLGVLVSPQSISNATQTLNLGAGVMSEFSFSKRLKLDVGVSYAKQNLTPSPGGRNSLADAMDSQMRNASFSNNFINSTYELSFGQLDIPINLKYKILAKDASEFYLITGLSNMLYLNQQNVGTFSSVNMLNAGFSSTQMVQTFTETARPKDGKSGIDMGRMLNFSVGYEYNLDNGTFLSLEPFYKMSIGNQTFVNQQFSIGGINLRMNFQLKNR